MSRARESAGGEAARADALAIFRAGLASVDPEEIVRASVRIEPPSPARPRGELVARGIEGPAAAELPSAAEARYDLAEIDRIVVAGMGKACERMALGLESAVGGLVSDGILAAKDRGPVAPSRLRFVQASHPEPDRRSAAAAEAILGLGRGMDARTLAVVLVSGGGSSMLCAPIEGVSVEDKAAATRLLLGCGAPIGEINCVRKHLSAVKGGRLAQAYAPARVLALVLSDVVGDDLDAIASGPTVPDPTTWADALEVVRRRGIESILPSSVARALREGAEGLRPETPKPGAPFFERSRALVVGSNALALAAAERRAKELGYSVLILTSRLTGEARDAARALLGVAKDIRSRTLQIARPACVICGGETTVTLRGKGRGGRNQELALSFLAEAVRSPRDMEGCCLLAASTDGVDGPTDAAGAFADLASLSRGREAGLDAAAFLDDNESYRYFEMVEALIKTGPTGTNVCDIQILLVH